MQKLMRNPVLFYIECVFCVCQRHFLLSLGRRDARKQACLLTAVPYVDSCSSLCIFRYFKLINFHTANFLVRCESFLFVLNADVALLPIDSLSVLKIALH